jgi:hypothetical protein
MKRSIKTGFVITAVLFLTLSLSAFAQTAKVNFSGSWALNTGKSQLGERPRASSVLTIVQKDNDLSIESTRTNMNGEEQKSTDKLTLDGKVTENATGMGKKKSSAKWSDDGKTLIVSSTTVMERDGNTMEFKTTENYKLSDDGKLLTLDATRSSQRGDSKTTAVYDKK